METFHQKLADKIDTLVHFIYKLTRKFPKDELYGTTSQLRRAALSIALNYTEGYARTRTLVMLNFFEIAYGSLKETAYLLKFCEKENYILKEELNTALPLLDEVGAMLWQTIRGLKTKV